MTGFLEKIGTLLLPTGRQRDSRVLVAGKPVVMTSLQARRYRELQRAKASARQEVIDDEPCGSETGCGC